MKTYCFALDLQDDPGLIAEYRSYHQQENVWEALMWKYQRPLPHARPNDKWVPMEKIFEVRS